VAHRVVHAKRVVGDLLHKLDHGLDGQNDETVNVGDESQRSKDQDDEHDRSQPNPVSSKRMHGGSPVDDRFCHEAAAIDL
jgi:hypothetical protein